MQLMKAISITLITAPNKRKQIMKDCEEEEP